MLMFAFTRYDKSSLPLGFDMGMAWKEKIIMYEIELRGHLILKILS